MNRFLLFGKQPMNSKRICILCASLFATFATIAHAHDAVSRDDFLTGFGWSFDEHVMVEEVAPNLHVIFGVGGNVAVSTGDQGILIVDDQFPQMVAKIEQAIADLGGGAVDFAVNTHWHFDHADGNPVLGGQGTWLVSQSASRRMMMSERLIDLVAASVSQPPYPPEGLPVITFDDAMQFHFNSEKIELLHFGPAHTTGDAAVIFRGSNAVHFGDVFNNAGYPFIDVHNGGDIDGMIRFCKKVLAHIDQHTRIIPGHGPLAGTEEVRDYIEMLETTRKRISRMIDAGMSLAQVVEAKPTEDFDERYGDARIYVDRAYASLARKGR